MSLAKEHLRKTVERLNSEEATEVLDFARYVRRRRGRPRSWDALASDPNFRVPTESADFKDVQPLEGAGIPASEQLIKDRR